MQTDSVEKATASGFQPVAEQCEGCDRIVEVEDGRFCSTYVQPAAKWRMGICNFATHAKPEVKVVKVRINPLKAAKRASKRKS
ncbi:MAG: hypothetical protein CSA33_02545 [Desulfobulbus propionicus]|nr:MAG: hypothetical protein CSA33_02545 [Desulfobulbus propionicus]